MVRARRFGHGNFDFVALLIKKWPRCGHTRLNSLLRGSGAAADRLKSLGHQGMVESPEVCGRYYNPVA